MQHGAPRKLSPALALGVALLWVAAVALATALPSADRHFANGERHLARGDLDAAEAEFVAAFEIFPAAAIVHDALGRVLVDAINPPRPERLVELFATLQNEQKSAEVYYWLARAYAVQGDIQKALDMLRIARENPARVVSRDQVDQAIRELQDDPNNGALPEPMLQLATLAAIVAIAFLFIVGLRRFVFTSTLDGSTTTRRDVILFLAIVLILVFAALAIGLIPPEQFSTLIEKIIGVFSPHE